MSGLDAAEAMPADPRDRPQAGPHVLIIVQNLPVPLDRRVWLECQSLVAAGYEVSVICPKGPGDSRYQFLDGVHIYKYRPAREARGLGGFVVEFGYSWLRTALLTLTVWMRRPFTVIQACNPPDTYWLLARLWRMRGVRFVFDQHDLNPELFWSRFGAPKGFVQRSEYFGLRFLEQMTYRTADHVISTNESYKNVAVRRGRRDPDDVTVVRSGPDTSTMRPVYPEPERPAGHAHSLVYLGIMGPQDGVDGVLAVMHELVHVRGRRDVHATLMGFGDCLESLKATCRQMGLNPYVTFTGRANKEMIADHLSAGDVGLSPDLKTPLNDVSTMNKTMEYMAYALPSVSFDLVETRVSGGESVLYVASGDILGFADAVERLLDHPELRLAMGMAARDRVASELDWRPQAVEYVRVFERMTGHLSVAAAQAEGMGEPLRAEFDRRGRRYVDLDDAEDFAYYIVNRRRKVRKATVVPTSKPADVASLGLVPTGKPADVASMGLVAAGKSADVASLGLVIDGPPTRRLLAGAANRTGGPRDRDR